MVVKSCAEKRQYWLKRLITRESLSLYTGKTGKVPSGPDPPVKPLTCEENPGGYLLLASTCLVKFSLVSEAAIAVVQGGQETS